MTPLSRLIMTGLFAALSGVLAQLHIPLPFTPVPVTLQTLAPMLAGLLLGPRHGALSQVVYLALGLAGAPVFAGGQGGPGVLLGPTGGYLLGHVAGAWLTGRLATAPWGRPLPRYGAAAAVGGIGGIYAIGVPWLAVVLDLPAGAALAAGALPFLPGDLIKVAAAALLAQRLAHALPGFPPA